VSYSHEPEWRRLRTDFEVRASSYPDLKLSVYYVIRGQPPSKVKFPEPNHAIYLWQHVGHVATGKSADEIMPLEPTPFGLRGADVTAIAVVFGLETDLFRRMAERAGSLIPDEVSRGITIEVASRFFEAGAEGKPVYGCNHNPLAKWLSLVLSTVATYQPRRFSTETLAVDPFAASLAALDYIIDQAQTAAADSETKLAIGLTPATLQQPAVDVTSLSAMATPNRSESQTMGTESDAPQPPKIFISYSWDSDEHKSWTKQLATQMRRDGLDVTLDQWAPSPAINCQSSWRLRSEKTATCLSSAHPTTSSNRTSARAASATRAIS
jgi:hypothetical protein